MLRVLVEGEEANELDMVDMELVTDLVQFLIEGDVLDPDHDGSLQMVLFSALFSHAMCYRLALILSSTD